MNCMGRSADEAVAASGLVYEPSNKHCEPITAEKPGTKCPKWAAPIAQRLLDLSEAVGAKKRVATCRGIAFVAHKTHPDGDVWHGYPESWDAIPEKIVNKWLRLKWITRRDRDRWWTEEEIALAWEELCDES